MASRIMISGAIAAHPVCGAGNTWAFLQYVLGFRRLGFEVYYVEQLESENRVDKECRPGDFISSENARYFRSIMDQFQLTGSAALLHPQGLGHVGLSHTEVEKLAPDIDLLINISGRLQIKSVLAGVRRRMYIDLDPGYTQIWQEQYGADMNLRDHDIYVTVGLNLGGPDCPLPTCGIHWQTTLPPVIIEEWAKACAPRPAYSTVADWRSFDPIEWRGVWYWQKAHQFKNIIDLPHRVEVPLEICLSIDPDEPDRLELERHGWRLVSPGVHAATTEAYRDYLIGSRAEFTVAKHGYVAGRSGWFSDRSACYLAAGRPVIVEDTGIGEYLPTGSGLLTFTDVESAAAAISAVESDYGRHAAAAAELARQFFDSNVVLPRLLRMAGV